MNALEKLEDILCTYYNQKELEQLINFLDWGNGDLYEFVRDTYCARYPKESERFFNPVAEGHKIYSHALTDVLVDLAITEYGNPLCPSCGKLLDTTPPSIDISDWRCNTPDCTGPIFVKEIK